MPIDIHEGSRRALTVLACFELKTGAFCTSGPIVLVVFINAVRAPASPVGQRTGWRRAVAKAKPTSPAACAHWRKVPL